jgi:2-methylisocitrate lyase-like PEP mutase family enzyme
MTGIQLEDQEMPKKCGHTPGRRVIPAEEMVLKIKVAAEARRDPNFLIVARTDSRTTLGLEEAIRRGRMYGDAGADIVIGKAISKPLLANMVEGGRTPILPAARLQEIGYAMAIYPAIGFLAAAAALERAYAHLKTTGDSLALGESYGFNKMTQLMGFPDVWDFEKKWAVPEKENVA